MEFERLVRRAGFGHLDRAASGVVAGGPVHIDEVLGRDELAVGAIDDEEEAVLRRMQDDLARRAVDREVGQDHRLGGRVVPVVAGCFLVVPQEFAGIGVQRDEGGEIEIVAAGRAAQVAVPRRAVAGADIDGVELGIIGDAVPRRAAAAVHPVFAGGIPGLGGSRHGLVFGRLGRIARHHEPAPRLVAGLGIVGRDIAADAVLGAAVADDHPAVGDAGRAGDGVGMAVVDDGVLFPDLLAGHRVEGDQPSVIGAHEDLAFVKRDAPVHDVAAASVAFLARHLGIEGPDALAGAGIDGMDDTPGSADIHDAVDDDRGRLDAARGIETVGPHQTEILDVSGVDLVELAESRLAVVQADRRPVLRRRRVGPNRIAVDRRCDGSYVSRRPLCLLRRRACAKSHRGDACRHRGRTDAEPVGKDAQERASGFGTTCKTPHGSLPGDLWRTSAFSNEAGTSRREEDETRTQDCCLLLRKRSLANVGAGGRGRQYRGFRAAQSRTETRSGAPCPFCTARALALRTVQALPPAPFSWARLWACP